MRFPRGTPLGRNSVPKARGASVLTRIRGPRRDGIVRAIGQVGSFSPSRLLPSMRTLPARYRGSSRRADMKGPLTIRERPVSFGRSGGVSDLVRQHFPDVALDDLGAIGGIVADEQVASVVDRQSGNELVGGRGSVREDTRVREGNLRSGGHVEAQDRGIDRWRLGDEQHALTV